MIDLFARQLLQPLGSKALHRKRAHHAAVEHRTAERRPASAPSAMPGSRRTRPRSCRPRRSDPQPLPAAMPGRGMSCATVPFRRPLGAKNAVAPYSPCFTTRIFGPISSTPRAACTRLLFPVSMRVSVSLISSTSRPFSTCRARRVVLDPVVHRVAAHQLRLRHRFAHAPLQHRIDVGQEQKFGIAIRSRNLRLERAEDIQLRVDASSPRSDCPGTSPPRRSSCPRPRSMPVVSILRASNTACSGAKIFAHHCDHAHVGKVAGRQREIGCRAAQAAFPASRRSFNSVERNAAHYGIAMSLSCVFD